MSGDDDDNNNNDNKIEVLIYGLGAIGSFYAFILQRCKNVRLSVAARSNHDAVKTNGLLVRSENHGEHRFRPAAVLRAPREAGHVFDYIVCANKAIDLRQTAGELAPVVDQERTTIVLMQNGVGNEDPFHEVFPRCPILSGVVWIGAAQESPGVVRQQVSESTTIGIFENSNIPLTKQQASLDRFTGLFREGGTPFVIDPEIQTERWKKCIWNAAWNALNALSGVECQTWLKSSEYAMNTTRTLMREGIKVARAVGVPGIEEPMVEQLIKRMQDFNGPVWTSMYHDSRNGRAMESDIILGSIVRKAKEHGIEVPTIETLYSLLLAMGQRLEREKAAQ